MSRPVDDPPNPFLSESLEWLEGPPAAQLRVEEEDARSILSRNDSPDLPFTWSLNPYRGCTHACAYCYARPSHEWLGYGAGTDFDSRIVVKRNAPSRLRRTFMKPSWRGEAIAFAGNTDCYQPLEARYALTRRCLEVCLEFRNPVGLVTKSALIRRDIDVIADLARHTTSSVTFSIGGLDDEIAAWLEPGAPPPSARLRALRALSDAGIPGHVLVAPIVPGLTDSGLPELLEAVADAGARSAHLLMLRLPGSTRRVFLERLRLAMPDRAARIEQRIRDAREGGLHSTEWFDRHRGKGAYWAMIEDLFHHHRDRLGLNDDRMQIDTGSFRRPVAEQLELFPDAADSAGG